MKVFKNIKVAMTYRDSGEVVDFLANHLFEDEELVAYFENGNTRLAFTTKRMFLHKLSGEKVNKGYYYSYRNIAAYGVHKNKLTLSLVNSPEYSRFVLKIKDLKPVVDEAGMVIKQGYDACEKMAELCRFLGNLIW